MNAETLKKFSVVTLSKIELKKINGGSGVTTNTCEGTTRYYFLTPAADEARDGDWYSTC